MLVKTHYPRGILKKAVLFFDSPEPWEGENGVDGRSGRSAYGEPKRLAKAIDRSEAGLRRAGANEVSRARGDNMRQTVAVLGPFGV